MIFLKKLSQDPHVFQVIYEVNFVGSVINRFVITKNKEVWLFEDAIAIINTIKKIMANCLFQKAR